MKLKVLLSLFAVFAAVSFAVLPALGQDDEPNDPGYKFYEAEAKKVLKSAGNKIWEAAEYAKRSGLHQYAYQQAVRALEFDPDQADARDHLGYEKKRDQWVLDEKAAGKVIKTNNRSEKESMESLQKKIDKWKEERLAKANRYVASRYVKLAGICNTKGLPLQAKKGYEAALRLDSDNAKARKGLGWKKMGKVWITKKQEKAMKQATKGVVVKEPSSWDALLSTKLTKVESEHFRIETPFTEADCQVWIHAAETAYAYYLSDMGYDPTLDMFRGNKASFLMLGTDDQWNLWVETNSNDPDFTKKLSGTGNIQGLYFGFRNQKSSTVQSRRDSLVHQTVHMLNHHMFKIGQSSSWVNEGLAYYYTVKVLNTTRTHCVAKKKVPKYGRGMVEEGGYKDWNDSNNWKPNMKELVSRKADVEFRALLNIPIHTLKFEQTIKAWSMASWMMDDDRDKWIEFLQSIKHGTPQEDSLQTLHDKGLEEIDKEWRKYVIRNY